MKKLSSEDKAGLYVTIIVHLVVIIILLIVQIGFSLQKENSFVMDFSREEAIEKKLEEERIEAEKEAFDAHISRKLDELIAGTSGADFKNIAVDRSTMLKDDRNTDTRQLYEDAERLAAELKNGIVPDEPDEDYVDISKPVKREEKAVKEYSGPSVVSYFLEGRKASSLPIPAYRCYGGGMVTVIIVVNNAGNVIAAKVQDETSSDDKCLRNFAIRAARLSKFSSSPNAPAKQGGNIVYQFIAQR